MKDDSPQKSAIRAQIRARLAAMPLPERAAASEAVRRQLGSLEVLRSARRVMAYLPLPDEVDLMPLLGDLLARGVILAVPCIDWEQRTMQPVRVSTLAAEAFRADRHGLRIPCDAEPVTTDRLDAILIPGLAFDGLGGRVGRGAGFYDRFLARPTVSGRFIGVGFDFQLIDRVPMNAHDVRLHLVVTDRRVIHPPGAGERPHG